MADRFRRIVYRQQVEKFLPLFFLIPDAPPALAGGHIRQGCVDFLFLFGNIDQIVVRLIGDGIFEKDGARGDDADHISLHQAFRLLRVLQLLADGHLVALLDKAVNINLRRMERNAAHRHPPISAGRLPRQCQLQFMGRRDCIVIEKLVEIPEPVKEKAVLVLLFHFLVLPHQRRLSHEISPFCLCDELEEHFAEFSLSPSEELGVRSEEWWCGAQIKKRRHF